MRIFLLLLLLLIPASCSFIPKEEPMEYDTLPQYSSQSVVQIIGYMGILDADTVYPIIYGILTRSENPCIGKDFIGYRECLIANISQEQQKLASNANMYPHEKEVLYNAIALFDFSLRQEVSFYDLYRELDMIPSLGAWEYGSGCRLAGYRIFDQGAFTGQAVVLSYWNSQQELSRILSQSQDLDIRSLSGIAIHENPCGMYTFGPDMGHIFYFAQVGNNQYFFIKTSDGGGSGDFNYTIYHNHGMTEEEKYTPIATFPAYGGATPFPQIIRDTEGNEIGMKRNQIITEFRNLPFQYMTLSEDQRTGYIHQISAILNESTPGIPHN